MQAVSTHKYDKHEKQNLCPIDFDNSNSKKKVVAPRSIDSRAQLKNRKAEKLRDYCCVTSSQLSPMLHSSIDQSAINAHLHVHVSDSTTEPDFVERNLEKKGNSGKNVCVFVSEIVREAMTGKPCAMPMTGDNLR